MARANIKKVVLAYSGGLDTSIILKWLQTTYGCEVVTFTANLGQGDELEPARQKALTLGVKPQNIFVEDLPGVAQCAQFDLQHPFDAFFWLRHGLLQARINVNFNITVTRRLSLPRNHAGGRTRFI